MPYRYGQCSAVLFCFARVSSLPQYNLYRDRHFQVQALSRFDTLGFVSGKLARPFCAACYRVDAGLQLIWIFRSWTASPAGKHGHSPIGLPQMLYRFLFSLWAKQYSGCAGWLRTWANILVGFKSGLRFCGPGRLSSKSGLVLFFQCCFQPIPCYPVLSGSIALFKFKPKAFGCGWQACSLPAFRWPCSVRLIAIVSRTCP